MELINDPERKLAILTLRHRDEELVWGTSAFTPPNIFDPVGLFRDINALWASMSEADQDRIWELYKEIYTVLGSIAETRRLRERLVPLVARFYELMPYGLFETWIKYRAKLIYPAKLQDEYTEQHPRESTYLRRDYQELAILCLMLRPMLPVFGRFMTIIRTPAAKHLERMTASLLSASCVPQTAPYKQLRQYIEHLKNRGLAETPLSMATKLAIVGTDDVGEVMFCTVLVRRITVGELSQTDDTISIVSAVHRFATTWLNNLEKSSGGRIAEKFKPSGNDEDNASRAEAVKPKTDVTPGSIATILAGIKDLEKLALMVEPSLDLGKLKLCKEAAESATVAGLLQCSKVQLLFMQYILGNQIPARALEYPTLEERISGLIVTQAVLWHWGFPQLAAYVLANDYDLSEHQRQQRVRTGSVSKESREILMRLYPYYPFVNNQDQRGRNDCVAITTINNLISMLGSRVWISNAPIELIAEATTIKPAARALDYNHEDELILPPEIADVLARFVIRLNER